MKLAALSLLLIISLASCAAMAKEDQPGLGMTQSECRVYREAEQTLHETYGAILNDPTYLKKPEVLKALQESEAAWEKFRSKATSAPEA